MEDYKVNKLQTFFEFLPNVLDTELDKLGIRQHLLCFYAQVSKS